YDEAQASLSEAQTLFARNDLHWQAADVALRRGLLFARAGDPAEAERVAEQGMAHVITLEEAGYEPTLVASAKLCRGVIAIVGHHYDTALDALEPRNGGRPLGPLDGFPGYAHLGAAVLARARERPDEEARALAAFDALATHGHLERWMRALFDPS
ncbi:MAG: hypothetical protein AAF602_15490, partial [Myxococcota bacterium]